MRRMKQFLAMLLGAAVMVTATPMYGFEVKAREEMMSLESGAYDPGLPETVC